MLIMNSFHKGGLSIATVLIIKYICLVYTNNKKYCKGAAPPSNYALTAR